MAWDHYIELKLYVSTERSVYILSREKKLVVEAGLKGGLGRG